MLTDQQCLVNYLEPTTSPTNVEFITKNFTEIYPEGKRIQYPTHVGRNGDKEYSFALVCLYTSQRLSKVTK